MKHKLKTLLLSALLLGLPLLAGAQTTTTVAGGTVNSYVVPLQYMNAPYAQWSQSIYPASYLTSLTGMQFTSFTYTLNYSGTLPDPGLYTISLGITTNVNLADGKDNTPTTQVFSGAPTIDGNTLTFTFNQPFTYTGGNLLVHFDRQAGTTETTESIAFNSISLTRASWTGRNSASMNDYNGTGTYFDYLPTVTITATEAEADPCQQTLPYTEDFAVEGLATTVQPPHAAAPLPDCWTVLGNGRFTAGYDTAATAFTYFSGVGYMTNINTFGCIEVGNPYFGFAAYEPYDGTYQTYIDNMANYGTRKFAILPTLDQPISQTMLSFDCRFTNKAGAALHIGYIVNDTSDFVSLKVDTTSAAAWRVTHRDTLNYANYAASIPAGARIALLWRTTNMVHTGDSPANFFCGIDNLKVEAEEADPLPEPTLEESILYWVGTGEEKAYLVLDMGSETRAWGYRYNASANPTVYNMVKAIDAADPRFAYTMSWDSGDSAFFYYEYPLHGSVEEFYFMVDGEVAGEADDMEDYAIADGMVVRVVDVNSDLSAAITPATVMTVPEDATIAPEDIRYWVGTGANQAILAINWAMPDTALAWGLRFDGTLTVTGALDYVAQYDSRLTTNSAHSVIDYSDGNVTLHSPAPAPAGSWGNTHQFILDGNPNAGITSTLSDGSFLKFGESAYAFGIDSTHSSYGDFPSRVVWNTKITPVSDPNAIEAPAPDPSQVQYFVGEGEVTSYLVMHFNTEEEPLSMVWGYRHDGTATAAQMLEAIDDADSRLSTIMAGSYLYNYYYTDDTYDLPTYFDASSEMALPFYNGELLINEGIESKVMGAGDRLEFIISDEMVMNITFRTTFVYVNDPNGTPDDQPVDATIAPEDILYWVGEGSNSMIMAVSWADTALAWGYRFDGSVTTQQVMDDIAAADSRFSYVGSGMISDILFTENGTTHQLSNATSWWTSYTNGYEDMGASQAHADGDFLKWADAATGTPVDSVYYDGWGWSYQYVWTRTVYPVSVSTPAGPADATIAPEAIRFWAGQGQNRAIVAVNWAEPDTCLAWGVRWDGNAVLKDLMDTIAMHDSRFSYTAYGSMLNDILYGLNTTDTLRLTTYSTSEWGNFWSFLVNGTMGMNYFTAMDIADGDFVKWGDPNSSDTAGVDEYGYPVLVWTTLVTPVTIPAGQPGPFCGIVGTEGCNAIAADSSAIVAWATGCTVTRGPQNIAIEGSPLASFGTEAMAIGPSDMGDFNNLTCVSLGDGGSATLTFAQPIRNGEGPDFAVYENSFDDYFLELAFVEVSTDGERFVRFPATSLTQTQTQIDGTGQLDATMINNLAGKFRNGYGTPFDLEELADSTGINIDSIVYVRIVDVVGSIDPQYATYDHLGNMVNDPWPTNFASSGFDLSAVAVLNQREATQGIDRAESLALEVYPNPASTTLHIVAPTATQATLFDLQGRTVRSLDLSEGHNTLQLEGLGGGIYMLRTAYSTTKVIVR